MADDFPPDGIYYEPRALWGLYTGGEADPDSRRPIGQNNFRNAGKYPVTVDRVVISSVNQIWDRENGAGDPLFAAPSFQTLLNSRFLSVGAPFRQSYTKRATKSATFRPKPTAEPGTNVYATSFFDTLGGNGFGSTLFNQARLNFDKPLYIPREGTIQCQLSSLDDWAQLGVDNVLLDNDLTAINASVAYIEAGGLFGGSARVKNVPVPVRAAAEGRVTPPSADGFPYPLPVGEAAANVNYPVVDNGVAFWAPEGTFSGSEFDRQNATRSGSTKIDGVSIAFDSLRYDSILRAAPFQPNGVIAPLSQRIGCAFTTVNGGSGEAWWRPGAPCALVLDSITPALVYELPEPITLGSGDDLEIEDILDTQTLFLLGAEPGARPRDTFALGISFNGYAAIEG